MTVKQMLSYVKKPGTTAETLEKFIDWLDSNCDAVDDLFRNNERLSLKQAKELDEYIALIEGIAKHPKVSQVNLRGLWIISFAWPAKVVIKILEGVQDAYTLILVYDHMKMNLRNWNRDDWGKIREMMVSKNVSNAHYFKNLYYVKPYCGDDDEGNYWNDDDEENYWNNHDNYNYADDRHFAEEFWEPVFDDAMEK